MKIVINTKASNDRVAYLFYKGSIKSDDKYLKFKSNHNIKYLMSKDNKLWLKVHGYKLNEKIIDNITIPSNGIIEGENIKKIKDLSKEIDKVKNPYNGFLNNDYKNFCFKLTPGDVFSGIFGYLGSSKKTENADCLINVRKDRILIQFNKDYNKVFIKKLRKEDKILDSLGVF